MIKAINSKKLKITPSSAVKTIIIYLLILLISFLFALSSAIHIGKQPYF